MKKPTDNTYRWQSVVLEGSIENVEFSTSVRISGSNTGLYDYEAHTHKTFVGFVNIICFRIIDSW